MENRKLDQESYIVARLRDLALVDVESLCVGTHGKEREQLVAAYITDLEDALQRARRCVHNLLQDVQTDLLHVLDLDSRTRVGEDGAKAVRRVQEQLRERATTFRQVMGMDEMITRVLTKLSEADRQSR